MKKSMFLLIGAYTFILVGCGKKENDIGRQWNAYIEKAVEKKSDITLDERYIQYENILKEEKIDEEGFCYSKDIDYSVLEDKNAVHVTFATNSYIDVQYFADPAMTQPLNYGEDYLYENDCIYAIINEIDNPNTDAYKFSEFEVWEYDEDERKLLETVKLEKDGLVFRIPDDFDIRDISIIPLGEYTSRIITLNDFFKDGNEIKTSLTGTWSINGEETSEDSISIGPVASCTITYSYDPQSYVFVEAEPSCLYNDEINGIIYFEEFSSDKHIDKFSVELQIKDDGAKFDPEKYKSEHAEIEYKYQGQVINDPIYIPNGGKISFKIMHVDNGYWISGSESGEVEIESIDNVPKSVHKKEKVNVTLPQPEKGGKIEYSIDGKSVVNDSVKVFIGSKIEMTFECKNGWSCNVKDGTTYTVVDKENQKINIDGRDVNDIFTEQQYKPSISIKEDKSIGTYTEFSIEAVDVNLSGLKFDEENKGILFKGEIGTKKDLMITASEGALLEGEALKIDIKKEKVGGGKEHDIQYIKKLPESVIISLYITDSNAVYKTVDITISKTKVDVFYVPVIENGTILVETADLTNNRYLRLDDVIESTRKIKLSLSAKSGYYVKDENETGTYLEEIKYSKYKRDIEKIIDKHPIKKLCNITLDDTDLYGVVTFKIDGKEVDPGEYRLKEEQKLEINYEITDSSYVIDKEGSNWIEERWNSIQNNTKEKVDIPIIRSLDGNRITRDMYIDVKNK